MFDFLNPISTGWKSANEEYNKVFHSNDFSKTNQDSLANIAVGVGAGLGVGVGIIALAPVIGVSVGGALGIGAVCLTTTAIGAGIGVAIGFIPQEAEKSMRTHSASQDRSPDSPRSQESAENAQAYTLDNLGNKIIEKIETFKGFITGTGNGNTNASQEKSESIHGTPQPSGHSSGQPDSSPLTTTTNEDKPAGSPNTSAGKPPENEQALTEKTKALTAKFEELNFNDSPLLALALRHNAMTCVLNKQVDDDAKIKDLKAINEIKTQKDIPAHLAPYINDIPSVKGFEGYLGTDPTIPLTKHFQKRFNNALETTQDSTPKLDSIKEIMDEVYGLITNPNTIQKKLNAILDKSTSSDQNASNLPPQPISTEGHAATNTSAHTLGNPLTSSSSAPAQGATNGVGGNGSSTSVSGGTLLAGGAGVRSTQDSQQATHAQSGAVELSTVGPAPAEMTAGTHSPQNSVAPEDPPRPDNTQAASSPSTQGGVTQASSDATSHVAAVVSNKQPIIEFVSGSDKQPSSSPITSNLGASNNSSKPSRWSLFSVNSGTRR